MNLIRRIEAGHGEFLLFALTPPRLATEPGQVREIADVTTARLRPLGLDGLILYDIADETERNPAERPFPFMPTLDPGRLPRRSPQRLADAGDRVSRGGQVRAR